MTVILKLKTLFFSFVDINLNYFKDFFGINLDFYQTLTVFAFFRSSEASISALTYISRNASNNEI